MVTLTMVKNKTVNHIILKRYNKYNIIKCISVEKPLDFQDEYTR